MRIKIVEEGFENDKRNVEMMNFTERMHNYFADEDDSKNDGGYFEDVTKKVLKGR